MSTAISRRTPSITLRKSVRGSSSRASRSSSRRLSRAEVIDPSKLSGSKIQFGARVKLSNVDSGEEHTYQIVGPEEADIKQNRISVSSPLARGLIGREVGDEVRVVMPAGPRTFEILEITYA